MKFNVLFMDGHAASIEVRMTGSMFDSSMFPPAQWGQYRNLMARGPGWRYDALPDSVIVEQYGIEPSSPVAPPQTSKAALRVGAVTADSSTGTANQ